MQVYTQVSDLPPDSRGRFITVGAFDGVHRGHQALLQRLRQLAREHSVHACVLTFEPHPQIILGKQPPLGILTTLSEKLEHISQIGINETIVLPFTTELARTDAETFVRHYLVEQLHIYGILVGHDHMFGRKRQGNAELLRRIGTEVGFIVEHFPPVTVGGIVVSSSAIRRALREGDVETAAKLLGRPYSLCGTVVHGDGRGRILGFPTANIVPEDPRKVLPAYGVYIVTTRISGKPHAGLLSYGVRPTFGRELPPQLELYVLDFSGTLYNERLCISFWSCIRAEVAFPDADTLRRQMEADEAYCRAWIAQHHALEPGSTTVLEHIHGDQGTKS